MEFLNAIFAVIAALGFSFVFKVPKNQLYIVAILAFCGFFIRQLCLYFGFGIELSVLFGAIVIDVIGVVLVRNKDILLHGVTLPAGIPMIPGSIVFKSIESLISFVSSPKADFEVLSQTLYYASKSIFILAALAFGLTASSILFKRR